MSSLSSFSSTHTLTTVAVLLAAWLLSTIVYRLYLDPLSSIPGPRLAAISNWYRLYHDVVQGGQFVFKVKEWHEIYGPIMRIAPDEVHINDVEFLDGIYVTAGRRIEKSYKSIGGLNVPNSMGATASHDLHRKRRDAIAGIFTMKSVRAMEPLFQEKIEKLCLLLECNVGQGKVNLSDVYYCFCRDITEQLNFGEDQDVLSDIRRGAALRHNLEGLLYGVHFNRMFPWVSKLMGMLPASVAMRLVPPGVIDLIEFQTRTHKIVERCLSETPDEKSTSKRAVIVELRDAPNLPTVEKGPARLHDEATLNLMAGVESPAAALSIATYHILANPPVLRKIREELSQLPQPYQLSSLEPLPYLNAVINETNRLSFGVASMLFRISPDESLMYHSQKNNKTYLLPAGTPLAMSSLCVHTSKKVFPDPWRFNPDRWLGDEAALCKKYMFAFGRGSRKCIGVNLATVEMLMALANVFGRFDLQLTETEEETVSFRADFQTAKPAADWRGEKSGVKVLVEGGK